MNDREALEKIGEIFAGLEQVYVLTTEEEGIADILVEMKIVEKIENDQGVASFSMIKKKTGGSGEAVFDPFVF